jgi:hypothetical protein
LALDREGAKRQKRTTSSSKIKKAGESRKRGRAGARYERHQRTSDAIVPVIGKNRRFHETIFRAVIDAAQGFALSATAR